MTAPLWLRAVCVAMAGLVAAPLAAATPDEVRDHVFLTVQRGATTVAGKALQQAALRQAAGDERLSALLRQRQDMTDIQARVRENIADAAARRGVRAETDVARFQAELEQLDERIGALDLRIEAEFPAFGELANPRPMTREEVQALLRPGEVLVLTLTSAHDVFVWAISPTRADWVAAPFEQGELESQVTLLRRMLDATGANRSAASLAGGGSGGIAVSSDGFDRGLAHHLYTRLLGPLEPVFRDATHLIAVVDGPLTSLPLALLVASPPQGDDADPAALRDTDWMIARYAMTVLPNVSSLRALRHRARAETVRPAGRQPFVGFGDPVFRYDEAPDRPTGMAEDAAEPGYATRGVFAQVAEVARLAPLPNTARELRQLARLTGAGDDALHLGRAATEAAVRSADLGSVDILAFATHGLLTGDLAGLSEPALVFTPPAEPGPGDDALLTATEAAALKLSARLIILSACNTAGSDGTPGAEGLSGLARAFIHAGARSVLVSHWPVDDYAASRLTTGMIAEMREGTPLSQAQRHAILGLMHETGRNSYAHPRYWAPFVLVGDD